MAWLQPSPTNTRPRSNVPFQNLWAPFVAAARHELHRRVSAPALSRFSTASLDALEDQLFTELGTVAELAVFELFREHLLEAHDTSDAYARFSEWMLDSGFATVFERFPVAARQVGTVLEGWVGRSAELVARLESDREAIVEAFGVGSDPGDVTSIDPALSDPHHGRRRVAALTFASGLRIVYKPRDVGTERAFSDLLTWAGGRGLRPAQCTLTVLQRDGYGWVECAEHAPQSTVDGVRTYYRQAGGLMCLAYLLRGQDLHMENLVATSRGPVLVDLELLLQPVSVAADRFIRATTASASLGSIEDSCLGSGLLSMVEISADGLAFDLGALRGDGTGVFGIARRVWKNQGLPSMHFVEQQTYAADVKNTVILDGAVQQPDDFAEAVIEGFESTYLFFHDRRDEVLAPSGPLQAFRDCAVRVIARPTNQYAMLSAVLAAPKYQRDGALRSASMDILHRPLNRAVSRPAVWPLVVEERRVLEGLDIPYFTVRSDETAVLGQDHRPIVTGYFVQSGLAAATERIRSMSEDELARQTGWLRRGLSESTRSRFISEPQPSTPSSPQATCLAAALWVARELDLHRRSPITRPPDHRSETSLYSGSAGVALFWAALAAVTRDDAWMIPAREASQPLLEAAGQSDRLGVGAGIGSSVFALTWLGTLLRDERYIHAARHVARQVTPDRIARDAQLDVMSGAAGTVLALLALHAVRPDADILATAIRCGDHLIASQVPMDVGAAWPAGATCYVGFAHGAAGIRYAIARLLREADSPERRAAVSHALAFEQHLFMPAHRNWPIVTQTLDDPVGTGGMMTAWCHGAPGVALASACAGPASDQLDLALEATARSPLGQPDHVCCGNLGRGEVLLTSGLATGRSAAVDRAYTIAAQVIARAERRRHFGLSSRGFEYRVFDPGFFQGLSGIGYELLRFADPAKLPSILAFEDARMIDARQLRSRQSSEVVE